MINTIENVSNKINHLSNVKLTLFMIIIRINVDLMTCNYVLLESEQNEIKKLILRRNKICKFKL